MYTGRHHIDKKLEDIKETERKIKQNKKMFPKLNIAKGRKEGLLWYE